MIFTYLIGRKTINGGYTFPAGPTGALVFKEGLNLHTGMESMAKEFGKLTDLESDLLVICAAIFAADRASQRGEREDFSREIQIYVPVHHLAKISPLLLLLSKILRDLSQDKWTIVLSQPKDLAVAHLIDEKSLSIAGKPGRALLFSGGLDSLAAAVEFGREPLLLVSHVTRNAVTDRAQSKLAELLAIGGFITDHRQFFVSSANAQYFLGEHAIESSQRTRSLVFLTLGVIAARRVGYRDIVMMAENGQMAIHLPLTSGRIGAFSTHTAHPAVVAGAAEFFSTILGAQITIHNPYVYKTKAEVVAIIIKNLPAGLQIATSCWKNTRITTAGATHCGECIPCFIRRISIERWQVDPTKYARDIWIEDIGSLSPEDDGRRNLIDLLEFVLRFRTQATNDLMCEFPELYSNAFDSGAAIDMYKRFAGEAQAVLGNYPQVQHFLK